MMQTTTINGTQSLNASSNSSPGVAGGDVFAAMLASMTSSLAGSGGDDPSQSGQQPGQASFQFMSLTMTVRSSVINMENQASSDLIDQTADALSSTNISQLDLQNLTGPATLTESEVQADATLSLVTVDNDLSGDYGEIETIASSAVGDDRLESIAAASQLTTQNVDADVAELDPIEAARIAAQFGTPIQTDLGTGKDDALSVQVIDPGPSVPNSSTELEAENDIQDGITFHTSVLTSSTDLTLSDGLLAAPTMQESSNATESTAMASMSGMAAQVLPNWLNQARRMSDDWQVTATAGRSVDLPDGDVGIELNMASMSSAENSIHTLSKAQAFQALTANFSQQQALSPAMLMQQAALLDEDRLVAGMDAQELVPGLGLRNDPNLALERSYGTNAAAAPSPPPPPVSLQIMQAFDGKSDRFEIQLTPEELGKVEIAMEFDSERRAQVTILVERVETLDLLSKDHRQLERMLASQGLDLGGGIQMGLSQDHGSSNHSFEDQQREGTDSSAPMAETPANPTPETPTPLISGNGLYDMTI